MESGDNTTYYEDVLDKLDSIDNTLSIVSVDITNAKNNINNLTYKVTFFTIPLVIYLFFKLFRKWGD